VAGDVALIMPALAYPRNLLVKFHEVMLIAGGKACSNIFAERESGSTSFAVSWTSYRIRPVR
jgi:hypothetical protein